MLPGYKSYIVAAAALVIGATRWYDGAPWNEVIAYLLSGAGLAAIRAAVAKVEERLGR